MLLAACIVGIFVVNEIRDPVARAVQQAYCDDPSKSTHINCDRGGEQYDKDNHGVTFRKAQWKAVIEVLDAGAPHSCKVFDNAVVEQGGAINLATEE
eukprot:SAG31_NODE_6547_length_1981_cov_2.016472_1_plen_97_part_00